MRLLEGKSKVSELVNNEWVEVPPPSQSFGCEKVIMRKQKIVGLVYNKVTVRLVGGEIIEGYENPPEFFEFTFSVSWKALNAIWQEFDGRDYPLSPEEVNLSLHDIAEVAAMKYNSSMTVGSYKK
jgi:hypothetical protein